MAKRVLLVSIIVAAILVVAAPAMAFSGYRSTYSTAADCQGCHADKYTGWATTAHASIPNNQEQIADGPGCAGCHSGNYDPQKAIPGADGLYPVEVSENGAFSEGMIGCSTCHYGGQVQHDAPAGALANADICGQCHSRYGNSKPPNDMYPLASPVPGGTINPQYPIGYKMLGEAGVTSWVNALPLTDLINVPTPEVPVSQYYYKLNTGTAQEVTLPWTVRAHDGGAMQYQEWRLEGHANALEGLKAAVGPNPPAACLKCHSQDYRMAPDNAKPTGAEAKYGVTCTTCHDAHKEGPQQNLWDSTRNAQLTTTRQELCVECHNAELEGKVAKPGSTVHHPMKEMMNGTGAIDVPQGSPSVHKGKCVQCHMPPTGYSRDGTKAVSANHDFGIIEPVVAAQAVSSGKINGAYVSMPYSACTQCHSRPDDNSAVWLQETLDNRQEAMASWNNRVAVALKAAAKRLGFKSTARANTAINKKPIKKWTKGQRAFQKSFTNQSYIVSEGSWGIHNWDYARTVILKALEQAKSVRR